jgi:hypothetical protein
LALSDRDENQLSERSADHFSLSPPLKELDQQSHTEERRSFIPLNKPIRSLFNTAVDMRVI